MKNNAKERIKVLIADDHEIMRMGLSSLFETDPSLDVIGEAVDGNEAVRKTLKLHPDVVVMDLMMPVKDGSEATQEIKRTLPGTKILLLTTFGTADGIAHALDAGASGALVKTVELKELVAAIRAVTAGERVISPEIEQILTDDPPVPKLSPRQSEILASIVRGLSTEDVARQLGLSVQMVKEHLSATFEKIGANTRAEAVAIALRKHLLKI